MSVSTVRASAQETIVTRDNLIDGRWQPASDGRTLDVVSPSDGQVFARIARGTAADIDAAVKAARRAFEEGPWARTPAVERGRLMMKLGQKILEHFDELAAARGRRHRQAHETGPCRHHGRRALLRVLRLGRGQVPRRRDSVPRRLHGHRAARAEGRHGSHHSLELSGADVRPDGRAGARDGQLHGAEACRGSVPHARAPGAAGAGSRLSRPA